MVTLLRFSLAFVLLLGLTRAAVAQPTPPEPDRAAIASRIEQLETLEATGELDEASQSALAQLRQAIQLLDEAAAARAQAGGFAKAAEIAPDRLTQIREELAQSPLDVAQAEIDALDRQAPLDVLSSELDEKKAELQSQRALMQELEAERSTRRTRLEAIPDLIAAERELLEEIRAALATPPDDAAPMSLVEAERLRLEAEANLRQATIESLEQERRSYQQREELLPLRLQQASRQVQVLERVVEALDRLVSARRITIATDVYEQAVRDADALRDAHPLVRRVAAENVEIAAEIARAAAANRAASAQLLEVTSLLFRWRSAFEESQARVDRVGLADYVGLHLRNQRSRLPDVRSRLHQLEEREESINDVQRSLLLREEQAQDGAEVDDQLKRLLESSDTPVPHAESDRTRAQLREALVDQALYLARFVSAHRARIDILEDLQEQETRLVGLVQDYRAFIDERILWIQSAEVLEVDDFVRAWSGLRWLFSAEHWATIWRLLWTDVRSNPSIYIVSVVLMVLLVALRPRLRRLIDSTAERVERPATDGLSLTLLCALWTALLACAYPLALAIVSWRLYGGAGGDEFASAVAGGIGRAAAILLAVELVWQLCRPNGLGDVHFGWLSAHLRLVRRHLPWLLPIALAAAFLVAVTDVNAAYRDSLGRFAFIAAMLALSVFTLRVLSPTQGILQGFLSRNEGGWIDHLRYVWFPVVVLAPAALGVAAGAGYFYTAIQLEQKLLDATWVVLAAIVVQAFLLRWLFLQQRRLAIRQAKERAAARAKKAQAQQSAAEAPKEEEKEEIDFAAVSAQTKGLLRTLTGFAIVIGVVLVWADVLPALNIFRDVELWSQVETVNESVLINGEPMIQAVEREAPITLAHIVWAVVIIAITVVISRNIPGILEISVLQRLPITPGGRYAITTVVRYAIIIIGSVLAFNAIGIGWEKVQWLAAAITVGLGFGLQEIFANFVSGLIILFERPIRVGDTVTVGDISGTVSRIRMRATTITDWDRKELIIPNKEFVTGQVINWTLSDPILRITIKVGVAYGSDTVKAHDILLRVAERNPRVLKEPAPAALFLGFGASSLDFELRVFIATIDDLLATRHELHFEIDQAFRAEDIEIAFPQQDIHIRSIRDEFPIRRVDDTGQNEPPERAPES